MGKMIEVAATELKNSTIEKISLVTNGAIQQGFKILKTEEIEAGGGMKDTINKFFGNSFDERSKVAALFVRKSVAKQWLPIIKSQGFRVEKEHAELDGDVLVLKQEGFDADTAGSLIALTPDVAIQLDRVVKSFDPYPSSANFEDNVKSAAFFPGLHNALSSLADTVWNVLNDSESPEDATAAVAKQVKAFGAHVNNLVGELPTAVFKMEQESLQSEFARSNVSNSTPETTNVTKDEDTDMTSITEVAAGDLDGLLDNIEKDDAALATTDDAAEAAVAKGDEGAPKSGGSPGNPVVESTSDTGAVALDEGGVPAGFRKEERVLKQMVDGKIVDKFAEFLINDETKEEVFIGFVEKSVEEDKIEDTVVTPEEVAYTPAEQALFAQLGVLAKSIEGLATKVSTQDEEIAAVKKTADVAQETAEETVVMSVAADLDESLVTLAGSAAVRKAQVEKSDDPFVGLLPQIEGNAA